MPKDRAAVARGDARLDALAGEFLAKPGVDWGRMFSTVGLRVRGKVFGLVNHGGRLMVKIPADRAGELVSQGAVERMVMNGRAMREWVEMPYEAGEDAWRSLLTEAYTYLDQITEK